jgi:hypothetical protein
MFSGSGSGVAFVAAKLFTAIFNCLLPAPCERHCNAAQPRLILTQRRRGFCIQQGRAIPT